MLTFFLFNTLNFIIHVIIAYPAFIMGWLIWDSKNLEKKRVLKNIYSTQSVGFWLIGIYLLFSYAFKDIDLLDIIFKTVLTIGTLSVCLGYYLEAFPTSKETKNKKKFLLYKNSIFVTGLLLLIGVFNLIALGIKVYGLDTFNIWFYYNELLNFSIVIFIAIILLLKYIVGLQKQHKNLLVGFIFFGLALFIQIVSKFLLQNDLRFIFWTQNLGGFWMLESAALVIGFLFIGKYALSFLRFRLKPQLFISFIAGSLTIFFVVTVVFLMVLINDFQKNTLFNLKASSKAIELSIIESRNDTILAAKALSDNEKVISGIRTQESKIFEQSVQDILIISDVDFITITNTAGISIYNTYDTESFGENLSNDKYLKRALEGIPTNTLVKDPGVLSPTMVGKTYLPVVQNETVIGAIIVGYIIDDQLVDSIKKRTDLEITIFSDNVRVATTFMTEDGLNRLTGTVENNEEIIDKVLKKGEIYGGVVDIFNVEHLAIYVPLRDSDENIIGMIFVGEPSEVLIAVANSSVQTTLKIITLLIFFFMIPIYFIIKKIAERQIL